MQKEANERVRQLDCDVAIFTVGPHLDELRETYAAQPEVLAYLDQVKGDLPEHLDDFRSGEVEGEPQALLGLLPGRTATSGFQQLSIIRRIPLASDV